MSGEQVIAEMQRLMALHKENMLMSAERSGERAAQKAVKDMLPTVMSEIRTHCEQITIKIANDARDKIFLEATGSDWKDRVVVRDTIQASIRGYRDFTTTKKAVLVGLGTAIGSSIAAIYMYFLN